MKSTDILKYHFKGTQEYEAILATPKNGGQEKYPLIVFPHGIVLNFWLFFIEFNDEDYRV